MKPHETQALPKPTPFPLSEITTGMRDVSDETERRFDQVDIQN